MFDFSSFSEGSERPALLESLDAIVCSDTAPSGLRGTICVGICGAGGDTFWSVEFGHNGPVTSFHGQCPPAVDALLFMTQSEAEGLHAGVPLGERIGSPTSEIRTVGDAALLTTFVERYLGQLTPLALQTSLRTREVGHA